MVLADAGAAGTETLAFDLLPAQAPNLQTGSPAQPADAAASGGAPAAARRVTVEITVAEPGAGPKEL